MFSANLPDFDSLWDDSQPGQTEARFRDLLLHVPEDDPAFLELLTQIARAQGLQHKFEKHIKQLTRSNEDWGKFPHAPMYDIFWNVDVSLIHRVIQKKHVHSLKKH